MKKVLEGRGVLRALGCRSGLVCCVSSRPVSVKPETGSPSLFFILSQEGGKGESKGGRKRGKEIRERRRRESELLNLRLPIFGSFPPQPLSV